MKPALKIAALAALALAAARAAGAAEQIEVGSVGSASAVLWPHYIAEAKGFYGDAGLKIDLVASQTGSEMLQSITAGSTTIGIAAGIADPMNAFAAGAGIAIVAIDGASGPYAVMAKKEIPSLKALKGRIVTVDGPKGATMVYFNKMLEANGLSVKDIDFTYAGSTAARFAALQSGTVDAAILTAPQLFTAESLGFANLGYAIDYAKDVPFTAEIVNVTWAEAHKATARKFLDAYMRAEAWFDDGKNEAEAERILAAATKMNEGDIAKSYAFLRKIDFFVPATHVDAAKIENFYDAFRALDPSLKLDVKKLTMTLE
jgi:NitT/TauT family transport system substrate-binding protein